MYTATQARQKVSERGARYAVIGAVRPGEDRCEYADTAELADEIAGEFRDWGYYQVRVHPPVGSVNLRPLGEARRAAIEAEREATAALKAAVLRALAEGRSEVEVAESAGVDRKTVRSWAGK